MDDGLLKTLITQIGTILTTRITVCGAIIVARINKKGKDT